jgi:two-component system, NarL family, invasion response regulator UvrY
MTRILVTDDHAIVRKGLKQVLAEEIADAVFGEADDSAGTLALLNEQLWDILILDINMPGRNGFEVLDEVRRNFPTLPVLVLSSTPEDQLGLRAIKSGAAGYLNKQTAAEKLVEAVQKILAGEQFMSVSLAHKIVADLRRDSHRSKHEDLSDREFQVFKLTIAGKSQKEIAADMSLSAKTISTFRGRVFEKLGVRNDVDLARYAQQHGLM